MTNIKSILILCLLAMAAAGMSAINIANAKADALAITVENLQQELAVKETEVTDLGNAVELAELEKLQLIEDRKQIARIQIEHQSELIRIQNQFQNEIELISKLKANENETISNWAAVHIPFDVGSMLRYAAAPTYNQNHNSNEASAGVTTSRVRHSLQGHQDF